MFIKRDPQGTPTVAGGESGQAIVLVALTMIILLGSLGLAIDGGGMFLLYRNAQAAVDAGLMAGAYAQCTGGDVESAVRTSLAENGFTDGVNTAQLSVHVPAANGDYANEPGTLEIELIAEKPSYFIQLVYGGPMRVAAGGVSGCLPGPTSIYGNNAIVATGTNCINQVRIQGADTDIDGGVFSNNDIQANKTTITDDVTSVNGTTGNNTTAGGTDISDPNNENVQDLNQPLIAPPLYTFDQFVGTGEFAVQAQADSRYYYYTSAQNGGYTSLPEGLHVFDTTDTVALKGISSSGAGLTVVARGEIKVQQSTNLLVPYIEQLTLFTNKGFVPDDPVTPEYEPITSGTCSTVIHFSSNGTNFNGLLYGPGGVVQFSAATSGTPTRGAVIGYGVESSTSSQSIIWDPAIIDPGPSRFGIFR